MVQLLSLLNNLIYENVNKIVISKAASASEEYTKIVIEEKSSDYQIAKYTEKQVFHENILKENLAQRCVELVFKHFRQINAWSNAYEYIILISKKGECSYKKKKYIAQNSSGSVVLMHNKKKNYIIEEGMRVPPLVDMGIFTIDGKVINSMYDKFKQINRFIEIIDDELSVSKLDEINIIDFGCGKSYLTFILYYYLTEIRQIKANIVGLDLKAEVVNKCNETAEKYDYKGLKFQLGDINGYTPPFKVDMIVTLHACDTATDYALYNAIKWNTRMIFSVPCCQHELNQQISPNSLSILTRYGIIKERFSALATDAIRANLLEYTGYKTQLLEFVDFSHTPKNILIRAIRRPFTTKFLMERSMSEIMSLIDEFKFHPKLFELLKEDGFFAING